MYLFNKLTCFNVTFNSALVLVLVLSVSTVSGYTRYTNGASSLTSSSSPYLPSSHRSSSSSPSFSSSSIKYKPKFLTVLPVTSASGNYQQRNYQSIPSYKSTGVTYAGNHNNKVTRLPSSGSSSFGKRIAPAASSIVAQKVPWTSYTPFGKSSSLRSNNKRETVYSAESNNSPYTSSSSPKLSSSYNDNSLNSIYSDLPSNSRMNKRPNVEFEDAPLSPPSSTPDGESIQATPPSNAKNAEIPLSPKCLGCICHANTNCDSNIKCVLNEFCGPYLISLKYWIEAGKPGGEYKTCVFNSTCAEKTVQSYMAKNLVDCNRDGYIDCDDYVAIHQLGPKHCQSSQNSLTNFYTSNYWNFYQYCYHLSPDARRKCYT